MGQLIQELKRRNVIRVAVAYAVAAWLMIEVSATTFPILRLPDWSVTLVTALLLIGFPLALILSWAFELTPEGIKLEKHVVRDDSITHVTGRKLDFVIIAMLVAALGYFAYDKFVLDPSRHTELVQTTTDAVIEQVTESGTAESADNSIAVLPFVAMSSGEDDGYFADGLTEELLNSLSQLSDLKVAGRTSSFYYKDKTPSFREVGEALGVAHVLEGSVRRAGNRLRITAQLIAVDDGYHLWSATYDRSMDDIFAIQDDIANQVTGALKVTLLGEEAAALASYGTDNAEAQSLYLIAKARLRLGSHVLSQDVGLRTGHLRSARRLLEQAVELDPDYAEAWAALGRAYLLVGTAVKDASGEALSHREAIKLSGGAVAKALALAPDLPEVRFADAQHLRAVFWYQSRETADRDRAITVFEVALEAAPNDVELLEAFADMRSSIDDKVGAIALYDRALALDPLSQVRLRRADAVFRTGRLAEARAEFMRIGELYPDAPWQLGIAAIEFDIGHLHHGILWSAGEPTYGWRFFAWATLGEKERALEGLSLIGSLGGEAAELVEIGRYYFERDYSGLQAWVDSQTDISMATHVSWTVKSYLRDWPAVLANFETWSQEIPARGENVRGTPAARERYFSHLFCFVMRILPLTWPTPTRRMARPMKQARSGPGRWNSWIGHTSVHLRRATRFGTCARSLQQAGAKPKRRSKASRRSMRPAGAG